MVGARKFLVGLCLVAAATGCDKDSDESETDFSSSTSAAGSSDTSGSSTGDSTSTGDGATSSSTDDPETPEEWDAWCLRRAQTEEGCPSRVPGTVRCDWVARYEFGAGECGSPEPTYECRHVVPAGDGCGTLVGEPGCEVGSPALHDGFDFPMYRVNADGTTSIIVSTVCGPPPGYEECSPDPAGLPEACYCLCGDA